MTKIISSNIISKGIKSSSCRIPMTIKWDLERALNLVFDLPNKNLLFAELLRKAKSRILQDLESFEMTLAPDLQR